MKWEGPKEYWLVHRKAGRTRDRRGLVSKKIRPDSGVLVTAAVDSVDDCLARVTNTAGKVVLPETAIPGVGYQARIRDPEGNVVGIMENDPSTR